MNKKFLSLLFLISPSLVFADTRKEFLEDVAPKARDLAAANDLYASVMIAQAALESGFGQSKLTKEANNLFGVKGEYKGESYKIQTREVINGKDEMVLAKFRKYPSVKESLQDYVNIVTGKNSKWLAEYYKGARFSVADTYKEATEHLTGRYATAPNYGKVLNQLIEQYNLTKYDKIKPKKYDRTQRVTINHSIQSDVFVANQPIDGYMTAYDAKNGIRKVATYPKGHYFIFSEFGNMINISRTKGVPGIWIKPGIVTRVDSSSKRVAKPKVQKSGSKTYTVVRGDYLIKIAKAHGISLNKLKALNNLKSGSLYPGDVLIVN